MFASRLSHVALVGVVASLLAFFTLSAVVAPGSPLAHRAVAQEAPAATVTLTSSATKAKIGELVAFTVRVENIGSESIPDLLINLGLPDALNARAINCHGETFGSTTFCIISDFPADSIVEVLFVVEAGTREPNGPVTAFVSSADIVLASAAIPPIKIVGPNRR
jgi:hypothetical protein